MSLIYLVHGFNVKDDGAGSVGTLTRSLEAGGHTVKLVTYGWMQRLRVRACTKGVAKVFASMVEPNSVVIAHSNGANVVNAAAEFGAVFEHVFLINPALDEDIAIPFARRVTVFHAPSDGWTRLARWIPFSDWGRQGQVGYTGDDDRYINVDLDFLSGGEKLGHSGVFKDVAIRTTMTAIIKGELP
jgi:hypothetical protein